MLIGSEPASIEQQRDNWMETARQYAVNADYYHKYRDELLLALKAVYNEHYEIVVALRPNFHEELRLLDGEAYHTLVPSLTPPPAQRPPDNGIAESANE